MANNTRTKAKKRSRAEDKEEEAAVIFEEQEKLIKDDHKPMTEEEEDEEDEDYEVDVSDNSDDDSDVASDIESDDLEFESDEEEEELEGPSGLKPIEEPEEGGEDKTAEEDSKTVGYAEEYDVSDDEDRKNTRGDVPSKWYDDLDHLGYDLDGKKIIRPNKVKDQLEQLIEKMENPNYGSTIHDRHTATDHQLTEEELGLVHNLIGGEFYSKDFESCPKYVDFFTHETMIHPLSNAPAHKRSFVPSKLESRRVGKYLNAIKRGWLKLDKPAPVEEQDRTFFDLWADDEAHKSKRDQALVKMQIVATKEKLPSHELSYNPPPEYLPTQQEIDNMSGDEETEDDNRRHRVVPKKYDSLRQVPQYKWFLHERLARNLDLYLCPRQKKNRVKINPADLLPKLPNPSDLRPFPTFQAMKFEGHEGMIRTISIDPTGNWLASGSDDGTLRVWEAGSGRCVRRFVLSGGDVASEPVKCVAWCPNAELNLIAAAVGKKVILINPSVGNMQIRKNTDHFIRTPVENEDSENEEEEDGEAEAEENKKSVEWKVVDGLHPVSQYKWIEINHVKPVNKVVWHSKSNYFATTMANDGHLQVFIHQLISRKTSVPFTKCKGQVQTVAFHHNLFFVATQRYVKVYDLVKQKLEKKLMCNMKHISSISVHPKGDNLLVGSYDSRLSWMDLDLSLKPYQSMRYHKKAVRAVQFHPTYPLFASASDDATIIIGHGLVFSDMSQNARIVPVKKLKGTRVEKNVGVLDCCWHPTQPWIYTSAADNVIRLFT